MNKVKVLSYCALAAALTLTACKGKKEEVKPQDFLRPATMDYTKQDSSNINYLVDRYTAAVEKGDFDTASRMLFKVHHDSIVPLTDKERTGFAKAYRQFHVYAARTNNFVLRSDKNNQVDVLIQIVKNGNLDKGEGVMTISLNPVVKNGKWYLTLLDKNAEGVVDVYDPNVNSY